LILAVRLYQYTLSPWLGGSCRFFPTCSEYAVMAIERHGPFRGGRQAAGRIGRCHPFARGGVDLP
jgi:hypothetical protein